MKDHILPLNSLLRKSYITSLNSHFHAAEHLPHHMVPESQEQKCGLRYVIYTLSGPIWTSVEHTHTEQWDYAGMTSISLNFDAWSGLNIYSREVEILLCQHGPICSGDL